MMILLQRRAIRLRALPPRLLASNPARPGEARIRHVPDQDVRIRRSCQESTVGGEREREDGSVHRHRLDWLLEVGAGVPDVDGSVFAGAGEETLGLLVG